jgi:hypothetical protein
VFSHNRKIIKNINNNHPFSSSPWRGLVVKNLEKMENKKEMRNWLNEFNLTIP